MRTGEEQKLMGAVLDGTGTVKSADRVLAVLDLVAERGPLSFSSIVAELGLPKSSAHNLLNTMIARGYLERDADQAAFRLGIRVWEIAQAEHRVEQLRSALKALMDGLVDATQETVQLARLEGIEVVYLEISESPRPMKLTSRVGVRLPAHTSALGKTLLAFLDEDELRARLDGHRFQALTEHTITEPDALVRALRVIRQRGYGTDDEEFAIGLRCIAMPIRDRNGNVTAAMSVSMPTPRYTDAIAARARFQLADAVAEAERRLRTLGP
jgi:DNA-binding IclR family transcriptional regulator